jgi:lincosamide and streptogramin A transport system ATP-binding/permease protein
MWIMLIISLFLRKNTFILLDEPTNHLDLAGKKTLSGYLKQKTGFILVSHDRQFLDEVTDHILAINKADITLTKGNYSDWKNNKDKSEVFEFRTKARLEKEIINLEKRAVNNRNWAAIAEKEKNPYATNNRGNSSRAARFMRQAKASELAVQNNIKVKKQLLKNYEVAKELVVNQDCYGSFKLVTIDNLNFGYDGVDLFKDFSLQINSGDRIWIRGRNGSGKSTLLKLIGKHLPSEQISYSENLTISESYQEPVLRTELIQADNNDKFSLDRWRDLCTCLDVEADTFNRPFETFSSGELKKADIARALAMENQLMLLDEPLNYTDVYFREQLEKALLIYTPTIVFVEHDERFGYRIANRIIEL